MTALYVTEVVLVLACVALAPWMRRAGEREWNRYRWHRRVHGIQQIIERGMVSIQEMGRSTGLLATEVVKVTEAMRDMGRVMGLPNDREGGEKP